MLTYKVRYRLPGQLFYKTIKNFLRILEDHVELVVLVLLLSSIIKLSVMTILKNLKNKSKIIILNSLHN